MAARACADHPRQRKRRHTGYRGGALGEDLRPHAVGRGTIRFAADEPIPLELVARIVEFRHDEVSREIAAEA